MILLAQRKETQGFEKTIVDNIKYNPFLGWYGQRNNAVPQRKCEDTIVIQLSSCTFSVPLTDQPRHRIPQFHGSFINWKIGAESETYCSSIIASLGPHIFCRQPTFYTYGPTRCFCWKSIVASIFEPLVNHHITSCTPPQLLLKGCGILQFWVNFWRLWEPGRR